MLLWRFVGKTNVILSNGEAWARHSHVVKSALSRNLPIHEFVSLGKKLFTKMGHGGLIKWDDYTMVRIFMIDIIWFISDRGKPIAFYPRCSRYVFGLESCPPK